MATSPLPRGDLQHTASLAGRPSPRRLAGTDELGSVDLQSKYTGGSLLIKELIWNVHIKAFELRFLREITTLVDWNMHIKAFELRFLKEITTLVDQYTD